MPLLPDGVRERIKKDLSVNLAKKVRLVLFTQESECQPCRDVSQLTNEIAALSDRVEVEALDFVREGKRAEELSVDKIPVLIVSGDDNYGVRFYGVPLGYELKTLIEDMIRASKGTTDLSDESKRKLASVDKPIHIQVFVTLTCPYCPTTVGLAHQFALQNPKIRADMIESTGFPHLVRRYGVMGVPKVVINEEIEFTGLIPEEQFVDSVLLALRSPKVYIV